MSSTPPLNQPSTGNPAAGDGEEVSVVGARGAQRTGRAVWILAISLGLIVVLMMGYWAVHTASLGSVNHASVRDLNAHDIRTYNAPEPSARQAPPGEPSTESNATH